MSDPRQQAFRILTRFEKPGKIKLKADSLLNETLKELASSEDKAFCTQLVYGVLRRWWYLESEIKSLSNYPFQKINPTVRTLLKLGFFQLGFMDSVPDYAALDTTVELARQEKQSAKTVSFINGVLRAWTRREKIPDTGIYLPEWYLAHLHSLYSKDQVSEISTWLQTPPPLTLRVNTLKTTVDEFQRLLKNNNVVAFSQSDEISECLVLEDFYGSPVHLPGYSDGYFYVQDVSSAQVAYWVDPQPGETIFDLCAAPGSKTTHLAALMNNTGSILAMDVSEKRLNLLSENIARLGVTNVRTRVVDSQNFQPPEEQTADRVLIDAPCSGLGTVRKHPEILIRLKEKEIRTFPPRQLALLQTGAEWLKPGGTLVYSTCSTHPDENEGVIRQFLAACPDFRLDREETRPIRETSDGFYIARLVKDLA